MTGGSGCGLNGSTRFCSIWLRNLRLPGAAFMRSPLSASDGMRIMARTANSNSICIEILRIFMVNNDNDGREVAVIVFI